MSTEEKSPRPASARRIVAAALTVHQAVGGLVGGHERHRAFNVLCLLRLCSLLVLKPWRLHVGRVIAHHANVVALRGHGRGVSGREGSGCVTQRLQSSMWGALSCAQPAHQQLIAEAVAQAAQRLFRGRIAGVADHAGEDDGGADQHNEAAAVALHHLRRHGLRGTGKRGT